MGGLLASRERALTALALAMGRGVPVKPLHENALRDREGGRLMQRALEACVRPVGGIGSSPGQARVPVCVPPCRHRTAIASPRGSGSSWS